MPDNVTLFSPPKTDVVVIGGEEYTIFECRPCDLEPWSRFIKALEAEKLLNSIKASIADKELRIDYDGAVNLMSKQPEAACGLLAAVLDPAPLSPASPAWRKGKTAQFMTLPIRETALGLGKWIEVNASFFARMATPILLSVAKIMAEVNTQVREKAILHYTSASGNA
jgi:hypothetical protein